jgi:hypothetical protein
VKYFIEDWGLWRKEAAIGGAEQLFGLKCFLCGKFSLGCKDHWFCGCCAKCEDKISEELKEDNINWDELSKEIANVK